MDKLKDIKSKMLSGDIGQDTKNFIGSMCRDKKRPLGKFNIWAWWVEIVRGCNISCWHCPTRLLPKGELLFMNKDTWVSMLNIIQEITPYGRLELCNAGEPTLHPQLIEYLSIAREICPNIQILTYTNGTQITTGKITYKQLFDAGLNMVFVDMYSPYDVHAKIAQDSGYYWYHQNHKPKDAPSVFTNYHDPDLHVIMLAENPSNWAKRKKSRGYMTTFFNDLDWEIAEKHGAKPVTSAPARRCDLPFKFANVNYDGTFPFCCFDYMRHTADKFGNINNGLNDFMEFYFGEYMQTTRKILRSKERFLHEYCGICAFTSIRCDIPYWAEDVLNQYWANGQWNKSKELF